MPQIPVIGRSPTYAELDGINTNLEGYWRFNGNANDEDGTASNLTITSGETFTHGFLCPGLNGAWIGGLTERRAFDRTSIDASLQINGDFTISCLFTPQRGQDIAANEGIVLCEVSGATESSTSLFNATSAGTRFTLCVVDEGWVGIILSNGSGARETFEFAQVARVVDGEPNHIVWRRSGTTSEIYINGVQVASATTTTGTGNGTGTTLIVGRSLGTARLNAGAISSLAIWSAALTSAEILSVFKKHLVMGTRADLAGGTDIDFEAGTTEYFDTLTANRTLTFSKPVQGQVIFIQLTQDGTGGRTLTLPGSAKVVNGTFNTTANAVNHVGIYCIDAAAPKYIVTYSDE